MTGRQIPPVDLQRKKQERTLRWQAWFAGGAKSSGPFAIHAAHCWISKIRAGSRWPDRIDSPAAQERTRRENCRDKLNFLLKRSSRNIMRAVRRGESMETIRRRGLLDASGKYQQYRGLAPRKISRF